MSEDKINFIINITVFILFIFTCWFGVYFMWDSFGSDMPDIFKYWVLFG